MREPHQLVHHGVAGTLRQLVHVGGRQADGGDRGEHANIDDPGPEYPRLDVQDVRVVGHDDGDDGHLRLDREVERAFLERQQVWLRRVRPRALGEDEDALLLAPHVCGRAVEGGARGGAVRAVDEDGFGEGHEPAQNRYPLQTLLSRDAAPAREDAADHQDVEFRLMIRHKHRRPHLQRLLAPSPSPLHPAPLRNLKRNLRRRPHKPLEHAAHRPLAQPPIARSAQRNRRHHAVGRRDHQREPGGQDAGVEGGAVRERGGGREGEGDGVEG